jgi:cysteine synthase
MGLLRFQKMKFEYARRAAKEEGLFVGISTGHPWLQCQKKCRNPCRIENITFKYERGTLCLLKVYLKWGTNTLSSSFFMISPQTGNHLC